MWLLSCAYILALGAAGAEPSGETGLPRPIPSRQTCFSIPFRVDQPTIPSKRAAAVQLYVSTDRGKSWSRSASVPSTKSHFLFRAAGDGEYWFGVRTLDRSNQLRPQELDRPGLIVIVDTVPPKMTLEAEHGESGLTTARWEVDEKKLDHRSLTILYRSGPNLPWLRVATDREQSHSTESTWSGTVSWMPIGGPGPIEVRAEIGDMAGNRDVSHTRVDFDRNFGGPVASVPTGAQSGGGTPGITPPYGGGWAASADQPPNSTVGGQPTGKDRSGGWRAAAKRPRTDAFRAAAPRSGNPDGSIPNPGEYAASSPDRSVAAKSNPPIRSQFTTSSDTAAPLDHHGDTLPRSRSKAVNSRLFQLGYDVDMAGHAHPARVELWGTRDGGRTWQSHGLDKDGRSPVLATVDAEGTYGFRVTVSAGGDSIGQVPHPGDPPDMLVTVDLTDPATRILSAERVSYGPAGPVVIRWDAADARLAQRPISIFHAIQPGGAWEPVARDLQNNGQYEWHLPGNLPTEVYLRLEARDEAGNIGISETREPIILTDDRKTAPF